MTEPGRKSASAAENREKPYLTDNVELGRVFRKKFTAGLRRLVYGGKLKLEDEWAKLHDRRGLKAWLDEITESDWSVFIEGPPHGQSRPEHVLKYLARYLTGEPISDRRIIRDEDGRVTFWARSKDKAKGKKNRSRPFSLPGKEFVRRRPTFGRCPHAHSSQRLHVFTTVRRLPRQKARCIHRVLPTAPWKVAAGGRQLGDRTVCTAQHRTNSTTVSTM